MTQRKSGAFRVPGRVPVPSLVEKAEDAEPARPDAQPPAQDKPTHEQQPGSDAGAANENDDAHGYSQDSGYQSSGGYAQPKETPLSIEMKTKKPGNGHTDSDEQIRSHIQKSLQKERAPRARHLQVSIGEGIVTLRGEVDDELERKRLTDLVRAVGAVRELHDELSTRATRNEIN